MEPALSMIILYSQVRQEALQNASFTPGVCGYMCPTRCSTVQHSTAQYSTVQYSTVQYSTVQYEWSLMQIRISLTDQQYSTVQYTFLVSYQSPSLHCRMKVSILVILLDLRKYLWNVEVSVKVVQRTADG